MAVLKLTAVLALLTLVACGQAGGPDGTARTPADEPVGDPVEDGIRPPPSPGPVERVDDLELTVEPDEQGAAVTARSTGERWFFVVTLASGFGSWEAAPDAGEGAERLTVLRGEVPGDADTDSAEDYPYEHADGVVVGPGDPVTIPGGVARGRELVQVCVEAAPVVVADYEDEPGRVVEMPVWHEGQTVYLACSPVTDLRGRG